jgi:hypothetical protein
MSKLHLKGNYIIHPLSTWLLNVHTWRDYFQNDGQTIRVGGQAIDYVFKGAFVE